MVIGYRKHATTVQSIMMSPPEHNRLIFLLMFVGLGNFLDGNTAAGLGEQGLPQEACTCSSGMPSHVHVSHHHLQGYVGLLAGK